MSALARAATALAFFLFASSAAAQSDAHEAIDEARRALRDGDAELAIDVLEEARAAHAEPAIDHELYVAYEQAGDRPRAIAALDRYLASDAELTPLERESLEGHLADLRASLEPRPSGDPWADPAVPIIGWTLLGVGIGALVTFVGAGTTALIFEQNLAPCPLGGDRCFRVSQSDVDVAWAIAWTGLASGVVLASVGGVLLVLAGEHQSGGTRSLPPDLDPTLQRPFSLVPWATPDGAGAAMRLAF